MNNELQIFTNEQFGNVRIVEDGDKILFCARDVVNILEYKDAVNAIKHHCRWVVKHHLPHPQSPDKQIEMSFIPEGDVYRLIAHSKLPKAQEFESWVFDEVLPSIRKHGAYMTEQTLEDALTSPDFLIRLATQLKEEQEARKALEAENAAMQPKALFADAVATADTSILVGEMAKILTQNGVKDMGQNRFFTWLRDNGYLMKTGSSKNMPTQMASEKGLIEIKESTKVDPNGTVRVMKTPKITGAGQQYFVNLFLNKASDNATA